jgi:Lon protease-like protein
MIGIFPLGIVLFPESIVKLHIFEERYKHLISDCIETKSEFGITPIISSKIQNVGCTASITDIVKRYDNGQLDILIKGDKRFTLLDYKIGSRLYYEADIALFVDEEGYPETELIEGCLNIYNKISEEIKSLQIEKIDINKLISRVPSFIFAQKSGLTMEQKYFVLQLTSENDRLEYIYNHLIKMEPYLKENEYISKIIQNDGYSRSRMY